MNLLAELKKRHVMTSDGAWGTFLHQKGLLPGQCPELWNITHPEEVFDIAQNYIDAGAELIETNSFGGSSIKLAHYQLDQRSAELNEAAAAISRRAAGENCFVLGSVGPTGKILMIGDTTEEELYDSFRIQVKALEQGGADAIIIETMSALDEATIAIRAAKENTLLPIICTFTFDASVQGGYRTMMGVSPEMMAEALLAAGADIIGANCGNGMAQMVEIVRAIQQATPSTPILVHANAGVPIIQEGKTVFPDTPEAMAALTPALIEAGAVIIGGCCGSTPEHIRAIAQIIRKYQQ